MSANTLTKPLDNRQFETLEQIVREVYAQGNPIIVEAPEEVYVVRTATTISVSLSGHCSKVVA